MSGLEDLAPVQFFARPDLDGRALCDAQYPEQADITDSEFVAMMDEMIAHQNSQEAVKGQMAEAV